MNGLGIRVYTDEDVDIDLASHLLARGYDVISTRDSGNAHQSLDDEWQLNYATSEHRAILTHNFGHYVQLDHAWKSRGQEHCGIILVEHVNIGELVRRTIAHLETYSPKDQHDTVLFLAP